MAILTIIHRNVPVDRRRVDRGNGSQMECGQTYYKSASVDRSETEGNSECQTEEWSTLQKKREGRK